MADAYIPSSSDDAKIHLLSILKQGLEALALPGVEVSFDNDNDSGELIVGLQGEYLLTISTEDIVEAESWGEDDDGDLEDE